MNNFFNFDGPFFRILNRISDLIVLNVLWVICSIPIVTIGASTTAMFYTAMKMVDGNESYVSRNFFKSFRENFRQSTIIWLIMLLVGAFLLFDLYVSFFVEIRVGGFLMNDILLPATFLATAIYLLVLMYVFPLQSKFVNKIKYTFKNALILSIRHLPFTLIFIAGLAAFGFLLLKFWYWIPIWFFLAFSALAYGFSFLYLKIFKLYIKEETPTDETPAEETLADDLPAEETLTDESLAEEKASEETEALKTEVEDPERELPH